MGNLPLWFVKISSGRVRTIRVVAALQPDREKHLHGEPDGDVEKDKRYGNKAGDRHYWPQAEPDQPVDDGLRSWLSVAGGFGHGVSPSRHAASRHTYRWCSPPTRGHATTFA